jgi:hypothetical protein
VGEYPQVRVQVLEIQAEYDASGYEENFPVIPFGDMVEMRILAEGEKRRHPVASEYKKNLGDEKRNNACRNEDAKKANHANCSAKENNRDKRSEFIMTSCFPAFYREDVRPAPFGGSPGK